MTSLTVVLPEKVVYEQCCQLLKLYGFAVYRLAQPRRSMQSLGLPDLYAMHADRGVLWMECKMDIGKQSPAQRAFQAQCQYAKVPYVCGGTPELAHWLNTRGDILPWPRPKGKRSADLEAGMVLTNLPHDYGVKE